MASSETGIAKSYLYDGEEARYVCGCQCNSMFVLVFWWVSMVDLLLFWISVMK